MLAIILTAMLVACKDTNPNGDGNNNDNKNGENATLTPANMIDGLAESLKITCKMTYVDPNNQYLNETYNIYKVGDAILTEKYDEDSEGYVYKYYKKSATTEYWAECALSVDDEAWNYIASDQTADTLLDINGIDLLGYVLYYFSHPSYGHKEQSELVSTEILTIGDNTYSCSKYAYTDAIFDTNKTFWIVDINGVDHCLKYTTDSYSVEVTAYSTTGVAFPSTNGVALPEDSDIPWEEDGEGGGNGESNKALILSIYNGTVNGFNATLEVAHDESQVTLSHQNVSVSKGANFTIYDDEALTDESNWWDLPVQDGNNLYYVKVTAEDNETSNTYTLNVFKNHYVKISYMSEGKEVASEQKLTHTTLGWGPKAYRRGYILNGWGAEGHYITQATSFNANWIKLDKYVRVNDLDRPDAEGDYVFFGQWAQTLKTNNVTIGETPDPITGLYLGSDGFDYARVSPSTTYSHYTSYKFDNGTAVEEGKTYYFKVEPIKWRILEIVEGKALLLSETILDFKAYNKGGGNDYASSGVRAWLTGDFYSYAFKDTQKAIIHVRSDIGDTIFAPSYDDMVNTDYGFSSNPNTTESTVRGRPLNDYLKARGAYMSTGIGVGNGSWWTRTPSSAGYVYAVWYKGIVGSVSADLSGEQYGMVPAVVINMS